MSVSLTKPVLTSFILVGLALPALAQNPAAPIATPDQNTSVLVGETTAPDTSLASSSPAVATTTPESVLPPAVATPVSAAPLAVPPQTATTSKLVDLDLQPVVAAPLANVSPESIGLPTAETLGADVWKGTSHTVAEHLLTLLAPTGSPTLNKLVLRLLATAAVPPEGTAESAQSLTALRVRKLIDFGEPAKAWSLAKQAEPKLIDDATFSFAVENALIGSNEAPCGQVPDYSKTRAGADWQKSIILCQLRAKDTKAAQVALDVLRAQNGHDTVFLALADKNILGTGKTLPFQLTPLNPAVLALLQMSNLPLPKDLYGHPDYALVPALLRAPAQQDLAQLALAERTMERGLIGNADLSAVYLSAKFSAEDLAAPLTAKESGLRLRALLFHAASDEKDTAKRIAYAVKFVRSATPAFLNGAGGLAADMLGDIKADAAFATDAATIARIYMLAGRGEAALDWLKLAQSTIANTGELQDLWPQFVLAGLEPDSAYTTDFGKWFDAALKSSDTASKQQAALENVSTTLLLLDAAGFAVPDTAWAKILVTTPNEKRVVFSPVLSERLHAASTANKHAESVLLAAALAGEDISLPVAASVTRALRLAGFKGEAATFARQTVAVLTNPN